jgi:serine protease Do
VTMKRSLVFCTTALLACGSVAMASVRVNYDQQTPEPPRRVQLPAGSFLGVQLEEVGSETVQRLKLRQERGALIDGVVSGSSAAQAGLQKNDVVVTWDGEKIESAREMSRHIRETPAGRTVRLGVFRDGREIEISVKMGARAALVSRPVARVTTRPDIEVRSRVADRGHLGVDLRSMTPQLAEYFGLSKRTGALVVFVFADSPAAKAGLKAGDVILNAGGETVETPLDLRRVLTAKPEGSLEVRVLRDKQEKTLTVQIEKGTKSWLLEPDHFGEADVRVAMAPIAVRVPKMKMVPAAIAMPKIVLAPMSVKVPTIKLAPMAVPSMKMNLTPRIAPMKIEMPIIKIPPVRLVIVPRRIVL